MSVTSERPATPIERVRTLVRVRQVREFTEQPVSDAELEAITEVARWSGSSSNEQPMRYVVVRERATIARIAELGMPQARGVRTAPAVICLVAPDTSGRELSIAFDDGRATERMLIAAYTLGLAAGMCSIRREARPAIGALLGLPEGRSVHHLVAVGHPTEAARRPNSLPGQARLPRDTVVFEERWPAD